MSLHGRNEPPVSVQFALITGASLGLGRAFAVELSKRGINTILVGLGNEGLEKTCHGLMQQFGTESVYYETDLTEKHNILALAEWVNASFEVNILINNVGAGGTKHFVDANVDYVDRIIQLNVKATSLVTHQLLPNLLRQSDSYILNVSSIAAFSPMGYKTVYPASKAFIDHFTRGLNRELSKTSVSVSLVSPGPMMTNSDNAARLKRQGFLAKLVLLTPQKVAAVSVRKLLNGEKAIVLNLANGINLFLMRFFPRRYITWRVRRELKVQPTTGPETSHPQTVKETA